ncbi:hypothetical protein H6F42_12575 [Pseudanabaena sp. FACHB-1998]|uniref:hypothetical protein n=1 Tax=Pseudanabaena sp. FACHB-1998 TaxID=2692858 RepID=UPI00167FFA79|nr:hypothetical protein [Pseudanabaena sp. FACHB-1998]MBD2177748.1 hypothetical protein [Pseudanabaena sp. FACHB-1998]
MSSPDWRLQPLKTFWQSVNWENRLITQVTSNSNGKVVSTLSFLMPVKDYFRAISWTGIPAIAATSEKISSPPSIDENSETLEDFLDDVSKFF